MTTVVILQRDGHEYWFVVETSDDNRLALVRALGCMCNDPDLDFGVMDSTRVLETVLDIQGATR